MQLNKPEKIVSFSWKYGIFISFIFIINEIISRKSAAFSADFLRDIPIVVVIILAGILVVAFSNRWITFGAAESSEDKDLNEM